MTPELDLFLGPELAMGIAWGLGAVLVALAIDMVEWGGFLIPAGELAGAAVLLALPVAHDVPPQAWWGLVALIAGGWITRLVKTAWLLPLLAAPGAWLLASAVVGYESEWVRWFVFGAIVLGSWAAASFSTSSPTARLAPAMHSLFALGILLAVPDTEGAVVLFGALGPLILLSLPLSRVRLSVAGAFALIGVSVWVIALGGVGRPASVIGAVACVGLLAADPLARLLTRSQKTTLDRLGAGWTALLVWLVAQLFVVLAVSRTAGLASSPTLASLVAVSLLGAVTAAGLVAGRSAGLGPDDP